jgi:hypothetical protein
MIFCPGGGEAWLAVEVEYDDGVSISIITVGRWISRSIMFVARTTVLASALHVQLAGVLWV